MYQVLCQRQERGHSLVGLQQPEMGTPMSRTATIRSLPQAFEMIKEMEAQGHEFGEDYREAGRRTLAGVLEAGDSNIASTPLSRPRTAEVALGAGQGLRHPLSRMSGALCGSVNALPIGQETAAATQSRRDGVLSVRAC